MQLAVIAKILGFVQNLPGFYIAALSAIATFNKTDIDKTMPAPAPKLDIVVQGHNIAIELTRRRFLCSMFAFLTAEKYDFGCFLYFWAGDFCTRDLCTTVASGQSLG